MSLDDLRAKFPQFGFAIYAYDPADEVVFEVLTPTGETFQTRGWSVQEAINAAFPPVDFFS
jgi:hypothetical protein